MIEMKIIFTFNKESETFIGRLPNGACFQFDLTEVRGKFRDNLELFAEAVKKYKPPEVKVVPPGIALGVKKDKSGLASRKEALRALNDLSIEV